MAFILMDADPIAYWGLIVAIISGVIALVAAVAAIYAAVYAKAAPTKEDLARVEKHVASTSALMDVQRRREELARKAARVPITVRGQTLAVEPTILHLTVKDPAFILREIDLRNEANSTTATVPCTHASGQQYTAIVTVQEMSLWFLTGNPTVSPQRMRLAIWAHLEIEGDVYPRDITVTVTSHNVQDPTKPNQLITGFNIE